MRRIFKNIEHKGPGQLTLLINPDDVQVVEATFQTSHHIIIRTDKPDHQLLKGRGWSHTPTKLFKKGLYHYTPDDLNVKTWHDLWGIYPYSKHTTTLINRLEHGSIIVDIGTYHGKSAAHMASLSDELNKGMIIYTVDPYGWAPQFIPHPPLNYHRNVRTWAKLELTTNINAISTSSVKAASFFPEDFVNHVHLDGCDDLKAVEQDIRSWLPKIKPEGSIDGVNYSKHVNTIKSIFKYVHVKEDLDIWVAFKQHSLI